MPATKPPWLIAPKPQGTLTNNGSTNPPWLIKNSTTQNTQPQEIDFSKKGTHEDFNRAYLAGAVAPSAGGNFVGGEGGSWVANESDPVADAEWNKANPNAKYVTSGSQWVGGEGGSMQTQKEVDWAKLPNEGNTKYGRIGEGAVPIQNLDRVIDKKYVYFDPAYGWITPGQNVEESQGAKIGKMIAMAGIGGLAGLAAPGIAAMALKGGIGAFPSLVSGNWQGAALGALGSGLSFGAGSMGAPSWLTQAIKPAVSTAGNYIRNR